MSVDYSKIIYPLKCKPIQANWHPAMLFGRLKVLYRRVHNLPSKYYEVKPYEQYYPLFKHLITITKHSHPRIRTAIGCCIFKLYNLFLSKGNEFKNYHLYEADFEAMIDVFINQLPFLQATGKQDQYDLTLQLLKLFNNAKIFETIIRFPNIDIESIYFRLFTTLFEVIRDSKSKILCTLVLKTLKQMFRVSEIIKPSIIVDLVLSNLINPKHTSIQRSLTKEILYLLNPEQLEFSLEFLNERIYHNHRYPNLSITGKEFQILTELFYISPSFVRPVLAEIRTTVLNPCHPNRNDAMWFLSEVIAFNSSDLENEFEMLWSTFAMVMVSGGFSFSLEVLLKHGNALLTMATTTAVVSDIQEMFRYHYDQGTQTEREELCKIIIKARTSSSE